jgi:hypothetical protein
VLGEVVFNNKRLVFRSALLLLMKQSLIVRFLIRLLGYWKMWIKCPTHGYVHCSMEIVEERWYKVEMKLNCPMNDFSFRYEKMIYPVGYIPQPL